MSLLPYYCVLQTVALVVLSACLWIRGHNHENEVGDVDTILHEVAKVYAHVTGGEICRAHHRAETIIAVADMEMRRIVDDETAPLRKEILQLTEERDYLAGRVDSLAADLMRAEGTLVMKGA